MIYQAGTIATTAGQTKIKGTGTRWKDNLAGISEGCPISYLINNVVYMNTVLSVNSDAEINLTYPVPVAASAVKYQIATFVLDSMSDGVRKMLANQQYIQYFLRNMDAWLTQDGIVEIKTPTGETVRIESIRALKSLIDAKLDSSALDGYATTESVSSALDGYATTESVSSALDGKFDKKGGTITKNGEALTLKNTSANQSLFLKFRKLDGTDRGFIGYPSDLDRLSIVNSVIGKSLTLAEDGRLTYDGNDIAQLNNTQATAANGAAKQFASPMWLSRTSGVNGEWVKIAKIGNGTSGSAGSRYLFTLNCTTEGFSSQSSVPSFGFLSVTIGNSSRANRNIETTYICNAHYNLHNQSPIRIKQLSAYEAEIWICIGPYSKLSCSCLGLNDMVSYENIVQADLPLVEDGAKSLYESNSIHTFAKTGDFGVGATRTEQLIKEDNYDNPRNRVFGFIYNNYGAIGAPFDWGGGIVFGRDPAASSSILYSPDWSTKLYFRAAISNEKMSDWVEFYSTGNTTKDSNGNLKAASPIVKLFADDIELNDESEGVEMEHLGIGHYLIKGVIGFNADGAWGINNGFVIPQDHNGKNMVLIDYEVRPDGDIEVFVFHQQNAEMPERFQNKRIKYFDEEGAPVYFENYEPCDVPESRWIDMRVEMPPNSIYNQKLAEAEQLAKIEAERVVKEETEKAAREEAERLDDESKQEQASKLEE
ncbi:cell envelope integrity protein TolA [Providencia alcalifaciens]|uniref:cell envelope integrity protein TolA n=1 Tax=Providencia alcalifaciens TaxID=126385 RepID=UPI001E4991B9|nr:hypothetical protein [Providencia alcalifaciens]